MEPSEKDILAAFDRLGTLHNRRLEQMGKTLKALPGAKRREALQAYAIELAFDFKKVIDPGFQRLIEGRTAKLGWVRRHAKELARIILLDILLPTRPSVRDAVQARTSRRRRGRRGKFVRTDDRDLRRLMTEYYPELFVEGGRSDIGLRKDGRVRPISTVYGQADQRPYLELAFTLSMMMAMFSARVRVSPHRILETSASIRLVEPRMLDHLVLFWQDLKEVLEDILVEFGRPRADRQWVVSQIRERGRVVDHTHQEIRWLLEARWFRTRSKAARDALIRKPIGFPYTRRDAAAIVSKTQAWIEDSTKIVNLISRGADAYTHLNRPVVGIWLYTELLRQLEMDDVDRALCHYNLAVCYRIAGKPRKMAEEIRKALGIQQHGGAPLDSALTLAMLAEANYMLGRRASGAKLRAEAEALLSQPYVAPQHRAYGFLQIADCAQRLGQGDWEWACLDRAADAAREHGDTDLELYLTQRLSDLAAGQSGKIPEDLPGRLSHPSEWRWEEPRPGYFVAVTPRT